MRLAEPIPGDGFAFLVELEEPGFVDKPGEFIFLGWKLYAPKRRTGDPSYRSAGPSTSSLTVKIVAIGDGLVRGEVSGHLTLSPYLGTTVGGAFQATLCP